MSRALCIASAAATLLLCSPVAAQVQRTFVASFGNDANACTFTQPCRSFSAAQSATSSGGEIIALDAAGYGSITITKSLSILANPGVYAGISASTGNAVTIATPGVNVRLSGLKINGLGAANGIHMTNGASLSVENCTISGFAHNGVWVQAAAQVRILDTFVGGNSLDGIAIEGGSADVVNSRALGNGRVGVFADAPAAGTSSLTAFNTVASQNLFTGFMSRAAVGTSVVTVSSSTADHNIFAGFYVFQSGGGTAALAMLASKATRNGTGIFNSGGTFHSAGNNLVIYNDANTSGTIVNIGTM